MEKAKVVGIVRPQVDRFIPTSSGRAGNAWKGVMSRGRPTSSVSVRDTALGGRGALTPGDNSKKRVLSEGERGGGTK